jgi:hypothetical protein
LGVFALLHFLEDSGLLDYIDCGATHAFTDDKCGTILQGKPSPISRKALATAAQTLIALDQLWPLMPRKTASSPLASRPIFAPRRLAAPCVYQKPQIRP